MLVCFSIWEELGKKRNKTGFPDSGARISNSSSGSHVHKSSNNNNAVGDSNNRRWEKEQRSPWS